MTAEEDNPTGSGAAEPSARTCPGCGAGLSPDAPEGLCAACLLKLSAATIPAPTPAPAPAPDNFTPPDLSDLQDKLRDFEILEPIGLGGMGAVYKARQPHLDRLVALKILPAEIAAQPGFADRFRHEAQAMAKLHHPRIVTVFEYGVTDPEGEEPLSWLIMEYVEGTTLAEVIRTQSLNPAQALGIVPQICEALAFAHEHGIVHRDIKPSNILLTKDGDIKVADFGLAKLFTEGEVGKKTETIQLTKTGSAMGTMAYMAPEQFEDSAHVDHRADIYSLGVVFYQLLTGELPRGVFDPPSHKVSIDIRLDVVVLKAMQKEPARRYQHASEIKSEVEEITSHPSAAPEPPKDHPRHRSRRAERSGLHKTLVAFALILLVPSLITWLGWTIKRNFFDSPDAEPIQAKTPETVFPLPIPERPTRAGKVVAWPLPESAATTQLYNLPPLLAEISDGIDDIVAITVGRSSIPSSGESSPGHFLAIRRDGSVLSWGMNKHGQTNVPVKLTGVVMVAATADASYALTADGLVTAWGRPRIGEMSLNPPPGLTDVVAISAGGNHCLALKSSGQVIPWGENVFGQCDLPPDLESVVSIAAGSNHSFALRHDGSVIAWGGDNYGETIVPSDLPTAVAIATQSQTSVALDENGRLVPWGGPFSTYLQQTATGRYSDFHLGITTVALAKTVAGNWTYFDEQSEWDANTHLADALAVAIASTHILAIVPEDAALLPSSVSPQTSATESASKDRPFENSMGMRFVPVPITGGPSDGQRVLFSIWETRVEDYEKFLEDDRTRKGEWTREGFLDDDHPVERASWDDAVAFCEWLTEEDRKRGALRTDEHYRLPTDHEWSCAVGIGKNEDAEATPAAKNGRFADVYPWGKKWPPPIGAGNYYGEEAKGNPVSEGRASIEGYNDRYDQTAPVESFEANVYGLFDMGGNVWEWCENWYEPAKEDRRVLRGASWYVGTEGTLRSSARTAYAPNNRRNHFGFRCVLVAEP